MQSNEEIHGQTTGIRGHFGAEEIKSRQADARAEGVSHERRVLRDNTNDRSLVEAQVSLVANQTLTQTPKASNPEKEARDIQASTSVSKEGRKVNEFASKNPDLLLGGGPKEVDETQRGELVAAVEEDEDDDGLGENKQKPLMGKLVGAEDQGLLTTEVAGTEAQVADTEAQVADTETQQAVTKLDESVAAKVKSGGKEQTQLKEIIVTRRAVFGDLAIAFQEKRNPDGAKEVELLTDTLTEMLEGLFQKHDIRPISRLYLFRDIQRSFALRANATNKSLDKENIEKAAKKILQDLLELIQDKQGRPVSEEKFNDITTEVLNDIVPALLQVLQSFIVARKSNNENDSKETPVNNKPISELLNDRVVKQDKVNEKIVDPVIEEMFKRLIADFSDEVAKVNARFAADRQEEKKAAEADEKAYQVKSDGIKHQEKNREILKEEIARKDLRSDNTEIELEQNTKVLTSTKTPLGDRRVTSLLTRDLHLSSRRARVQ